MRLLTLGRGARLFGVLAYLASESNRKVFKWSFRQCTFLNGVKLLTEIIGRLWGLSRIFAPSRNDF